jgi:hypothetical protein
MSPSHPGRIRQFLEIAIASLLKPWHRLFNVTFAFDPDVLDAVWVFDLGA